jgi:hypothetical protein
MNDPPVPQDWPGDEMTLLGADGLAYPGETDLPAPSPGTLPNRNSSGPCLYLGPAGQRCYRRSIDGMYCVGHPLGEIARRIANPRRVVAATVTIVALLWPYLDELLHELIRWKQSR